MTTNDLAEDCQEALAKLLDKKIVSVKFKSYNGDCWRMHIDTDKGEVVMTFCRDWTCPVVEYRGQK
jgi:hypothetical protein